MTKQKINKRKLAMKMISKAELAEKGKSIFTSYAWETRKAAIEKRVLLSNLRHAQRKGI